MDGSLKVVTPTTLVHTPWPFFKISLEVPVRPASMVATTFAEQGTTSFQAWKMETSAVSSLPFCRKVIH